MRFRPQRYAPSSGEVETLAADLCARLGPDAEVITDEDRRDLYARDRFEPSRLRVSRPALALRPNAAEDIAAAVKWAHARRLPVTPRGLSTTAHGESTPAHGGLVIDLAGFNRIGPLDAGAHTVRVQAGAAWGDLDAYLDGSGFALATYPASRFSTVGGWVATGGLGINSFGYGHLRQWVAALEVVTGAGEVQTFTPGEARFAAFFGAEGTLGVATAVTLRLRPAPAFARAHLFYFDSTADQLQFVRHLIDSGAHLAHVGLFDRRHMRYQNRLYEEAHPDRSPFYLERPAILVHVDAAVQEQALEDALAHAETLAEEAPPYAAAALWQGRFYPFALKRYGPSLLTAPVLLPVGETAAFIDEAMRLGEQFGLSPAAHAFIAQTDDRYEALVTPLYPCDSRRRAYRLHVFMTHLATRAAVRRGGRPYAVGTLNAPFATMTPRTDAETLFNPRPRRPLRRRVMRAALRAAGTFSAQVGQVARLLNRHDAPPAAPPRPRASPLTGAELEATIDACTGCGSCIPVCPAYLLTGDEATTGRAKLQTGRRVLHGGAVRQSLAESAFLCTYCKACQDVCEVELPLIAAYAAIEAELAAHYGRPDARIAAFVAQAESSAAYLQFVGASPFPTAGSRDDTTRHDAPAASETFAPSQRDPVGPFNVVRSEHCVNCGQCVRVCPADVHRRRDDDPRLMAQPVSHRCVGCFRCVQECPPRALTLTPSPAYAGLGRGIYTPDTILRLTRQAETGRTPPESAPAPRKAGAGDAPGFADIGFHARIDPGGISRRRHRAGEQTAVTLGRQLECLPSDEAGAPRAVVPPTLALAAPFVLALPPVAVQTRDALNAALATVARRRRALALLDWADRREAWAESAAWIAPRLPADAVDEAGDALARFRLLVVEGLERAIARLRTRYPGLMLAADVPLDRHAAEVTLRMVHAGADVVILSGCDGLDGDGASDLVRYLPEVHAALVAVSRRERVSLLARGDIASADSAVKALLLGADAAVIDWPLLVALEHRLNTQREFSLTNVEWAVPRLANLLCAWQNDLTRAMADLGIVDAHHLRGAQDRVIVERGIEAQGVDHLRRVDSRASAQLLLGR